MKRNTLIIGIILAAVIIIGLMVGRSNKSQVPSELRIGAALGFTGGGSAWGEQEKRGIELALADLKEAHPEQTISVVYEDTHSTAKDGISAVSKLISVDHVNYIIGPTWLDSYGGAQSLLDTNPEVTMVAPSANISTIQEGTVRTNLYSTWYRVEDDAKKLVDLAKTRGSKRIAVLSLNDAYYIKYMAEFKKIAASKGIEVVSEEFLNYGTDPKTTLEKMRALNPDTIMVASYDQESVTVAFRFIQQQFPKTTIRLGTNIVEYLVASKDTTEQSLVNDYWYIKPKAASKDFVEKYQKAYGTLPELSASHAYDAVMLIAEKLSRGVDVHKQTVNTATYGPVMFDELNGIKTSDSNRFYDNYTIEGGKEILK